MSINTKKKPTFTVPLRIMLTIPFIVLLFFSIGTVGLISYLNGQKAVNFAAHQFRDVTISSIEQHLSTFLNTPHQINRLNAFTIQNGGLDLHDPEKMQLYFLEQVQIYPSVTSIYFGNTEGGIAGSGRESDGSLYVTASDGFTSGTFSKFGVNSFDHILAAPLAEVPNFDSRTRPWYLGALENKGAAWTDIYVLFTGQDIAIAASRPVYDQNDNLIGVVSVDIFLSNLSSYLETLAISHLGQIFIIDHTDALVATSSGEALFKDANNDGVRERVLAKESQSRLVQQADQILQNLHIKTEHTLSEEQIEFTFDGEKYFMQHMAVQDDYGLDWVVVAIIPESAFMGHIEEANIHNMELVIAALILAAMTSIFITSRITRRISQLDQSVRALADGTWDTELTADAHISELNGLATSFNTMKERLQSTLAHLSTEIAERIKTEKNLKAQKDFYTQILNLMGQGLTVTNEEGEFEFINPAYAKILGCKQEDVIGKTPNNFADPEGVEILAEQRKIRQTGNSSSYEFNLLRVDGSGAPVLITSVPRISNGKFIGTITVITDLTDQKITESELRRAKEALENTNTRLEQVLEREREMARIDGLTGINNRRHLLDLAEQKYALAMRHTQALSILMFDIDHFKLVNDEWGHAVGDIVLMEVAALVKSTMRSSDIFGRYGGEEFIILMPMTKANRAFILAERIRTKVENMTIPSLDMGIKITISVGIVEVSHTPQQESLDNLFAHADDAMYAAKSRGRNCTVIWNSNNAREEGTSQP